MGLPSHQLRQERPNPAAVYVRHRPETTLLYQIIQEYWPEFQVELTNHGKYLPAYVTKEFDEYLKCGRLEHGFLRVPWGISKFAISVVVMSGSLPVLKTRW